MPVWMAVFAIADIGLNLPATDMGRGTSRAGLETERGRAGED